MKYLYFIVVLGFLSSCSGVKSNVFIPSNKVDIAISASMFELDDLGYIYFVTDRNSIVKYDKKGQLFDYNFNYDNNGDISYINVDNPQKILVFYRDFQQLEYLDNTLSKISSFQLNKLSDEISLVTVSNDNNIWVFDAIDSRVKKVSNDGDELITSIPISDIVSSVFRPNYLKEVNNYVYIYDPSHGLIQFDNTGNYLKRYSILGKTINTIDQNTLSYLENNALFESTIANEKTTIRLELDYSPTMIRRNENHWFILTEQGVIFDSLNK